MSKKGLAAVTARYLCTKDSELIWASWWWKPGLGHSQSESITSTRTSAM
jgi:hypothetical protein